MRAMFSYMNIWITQQKKKKKKGVTNSHPRKNWIFMQKNVIVNELYTSWMN
jgi:hypothetical protein